MAFPADQVAEVKQFCPDLQQCEEAGCAFLLLPMLTLPEGCSPRRTDALLCPSAREGYPSRLYFADRVRSRAQLNWNATGVRIVERVWQAYSWKLTHSNLRLAQMIALHLRALR